MHTPLVSTAPLAADLFDRRHEHTEEPWIRRFVAFATRHDAAERVAISSPSGTLSYAEAHRESDRIARFLLRHGYAPGAVVATYFDRDDPRNALWLIGLAKAGLCAHFLEAQLGTELLVARLEHGVHAVVVGAGRGDFVEAARAAHPEIAIWEEPELPEEDEAPLEPVEVPPSAPAFLVLSSGTTGVSKAAYVFYRSVHDVCSSLFIQNIDDRSVVFLQLARFNFDAVYVEIITAFVFGREVALIPEAAVLDPEVLLEHIVARSITHVTFTPTHLQGLLEALPTGAQRARLLASIQEIMLVGEKATAELLRALHRDGPVGLCVTNGYGPTEAGIGSTYGVIFKKRGADSAFSPPEHLLLGHPARGTAIRVGVRGPEGEWRLYAPGAMPVGGEGEIFIDNGAPNSYLRAELNEERYLRLRDPITGASRLFFHTRDRVRVVRGADGKIGLSFIGRADHLVKIAAQAVQLEDLRADLQGVLSALDPESDARLFVDAEPDPQTGRLALVGYLTAPDLGAAMGRVEALSAALRGRVESFKIPSRFLWVRSFPIRVGGKLDVPALRREAEVVDKSEAQRRDESFFRGLTHAEREVLRCVQEVCLSPQPLLLDRVLDHCRDSLMLMSLQARVSHDLGAKLEVTRMRGMRLCDLAREVEEGGRREAIPLRTKIREGAPGHRPLFLLPPGDGSSLIYLHLAEVLDERWPMYAFRCEGSEPGEEIPERSIGEHARIWADLLEEVQPEGPIHLGGFCYGGLPAYEMAELLAQRGREIALLALFDCPDHDQGPLGVGPLDELAQTFAILFGPILETEEVRVAILGGDGSRSPREEDPMVQEAAFRMLLKRGQEIGAIPLHFEADRIRRIMQMEKKTGGSLFRHTFTPRLTRFAGAAFFFRAASEAKMRWRPDPWRSWAPKIPGLKIIDLPSTHLDMMMKHRHLEAIVERLGPHLSAT